MSGIFSRPFTYFSRHNNHNTIDIKTPSKNPKLPNTSNVLSMASSPLPIYQGNINRPKNCPKIGNSTTAIANFVDIPTCVNNGFVVGMTSSNVDFVLFDLLGDTF